MTDKTVAAAMHLVEQHRIRRDDPRWQALDAACFAGKNVYNAANYALRQLLFAGKPRLSYEKQEKQFKKHNLLPDQQLPLKVVQQVLKGLHRDWDSYDAATIEYGQHPDKFTGAPQLPRYKHKTDGRCTLLFTAQALSKAGLKRGEVVLSGLGVKVHTCQSHIDCVRVVPHHSHYTVEVVYTAQIKPVPLDDTLYAAIDTGVDVLAALTSNKPGFEPFLVNGRPLKAINQHYNKGRAALQSRLPEKRHTSRQLEALTFARNRRIDAQLHLASRYIVEVLKREGIGHLVIGKNVGWKQEVALGKVNNQNFVDIPHARFIDLLTYKAVLVGLEVSVLEESYTSKCSFLDSETVGKHEQYAGRRVKRGLFRASDGRTIQADLNGSYNILRKAAPGAAPDPQTAQRHGQRLNPCDLQKHLQTWRHDEVGGRTVVPLGRPPSPKLVE